MFKLESLSNGCLKDILDRIERRNFIKIIFRRAFHILIYSPCILQELEIT